jgi:hypothetical protein
VAATIAPARSSNVMSSSAWSSGSARKPRKVAWGIQGDGRKASVKSLSNRRPGQPKVDRKPQVEQTSADDSIGTGPAQIEAMDIEGSLRSARNDTVAGGQNHDGGGTGRGTPRDRKRLGCKGCRTIAGTAFDRQTQSVQRETFAPAKNAGHRLVVEPADARAAGLFRNGAHARRYSTRWTCATKTPTQTSKRR